MDCREELCLPEDNVWSKGDDNYLASNIEGVSDSGAIVLSGTFSLSEQQGYLQILLTQRSSELIKKQALNDSDCLNFNIRDNFESSLFLFQVEDP